MRSTTHTYVAVVDDDPNVGRPLLPARTGMRAVTDDSA
jgi:hypothetical protein